MSSITRHIDNVQRDGAELAEGISNLADLHMELLGEEMREQRRLLLRGAVAAAAAMLVGLCALIVLSFAIAQFISSFGYGEAAALAAVAVLWMAASAGLLYAALRFLKRVHLIPSATLSSLKESMRCLMRIN